MSSSETAPALVVSPTPPSPETRDFFLSRFGPDVEFADLAGLRRAGLWSLRRRRTSVVVATAPARELPLFEDYLILLAFLVPGARRERLLPGEAPLPLGFLSALRSALRVAAGLLAGVGALAANGVRAWRLGRRAWVPYRLGGDLALPLPQAHPQLRARVSEAQSPTWRASPTHSRARASRCAC